ncbi:bilin-binding protein-like [Danaus plexippus]|uniref:bilin-binding protein-like n=1 Tax=Danaus plexippus TaxID=13037 RepID=UPI002AAF8AEE|nr:bilin-binding protein-like [Danaus plexippus]
MTTEKKRVPSAVTQYTPMGDRFKIENIGLRHNKKYEIDGYGRLAPDAGSTGKLIFTLPYGKNGQNTDNILNIMSTDNANYAVLYHCNYNEETKTKQELSWIVSRTKTLRSDFKALIDRYLLESKVLDLSKYIFPDFSDNVCRIDF